MPPKETITEGGGLVGIAAVYQQETLGYDLKKANAAGDTLYILQGRDENGKRSLRTSNKTVRLGENEEKLFANEDNYVLLQYIKDKKMTTKEYFDTFVIKTSASSTENDLGRDYGYLSEYNGYHSVSF